MFKKLSMTALLLGALVLSAQPTFAAAGWQLLGIDHITPTGTNWTPPDETGYIRTLQDGGNVGFKVPAHTVSNGVSSPTLEIKVYDDDGALGRDWIATVYYYPKSDGTKTFTIDASSFADGTNGQAEIVAEYTYNYGTSGVVSIDVLD
jgi:hypothetical protein